MSLTTRIDCEACKSVYEEYEINPPCGTCFPGIHEYNTPILQLYRACQGQYIAGSGGIIGLNDMAIGHAMDYYFEVDPEDRLELSLKVRHLASMIIDHQRKDAENKGNKK